MFKGLQCLPLGKARMHLSQPKETWGWNNYLISVRSFTDFLCLFFLLRLFYSLQATYQHYRQCSLEVIWRRDWCKTHWMYWMHLCLYHLCLNRLCGWYCWWKKSQTTSWYGKYPITYRVLYIPGGWPWDFFHQHRTLKSGVERRQTMIPKLSLGSLPQRSMKNKTPVALNWMHPKTMKNHEQKPVFFHQNGEIH